LLRRRDRYRAASPACSGGDPVPREDATLGHGRKSALFIFEIVLHGRKSFDNGLDFLPELGSGQIIPLKNGSGSYANLLVTRFARVGNTSRRVEPTWPNSESSGRLLWHPI
jgi:hypothetical protein